MTLVDDSYNSSLAALARALEALAATSTDGCRVAAIGEMRELGELSLALHEESAAAQSPLGLERLIAVGGDSAKALADAAIAAGLPADRAGTSPPH